MLFEAGNLITIGIMLLILVFFRLLDKNNNSLNKVKKYTERCKEDIAIYVQDKGAVIKDYGIALEVERKSAVELMRRLQTLTREELAQKVEALTEIDDRIRDYDSSLEELIQMTGRVQENLSRIKDESSFVENVGRRVGEIKEKIETFDKEIVSIGKRLVGLEDRFERENTEALEKAIEEIINAAKSTVADLEAGARTIEREMEEHRKTADKLDHEREEKFIHSEKQFEKLFLEAIDRAGSRADKAEEAAIAKLRDQAQERLTGVKASFEEKIKTVQETIKAKLSEIQEQVKNNREDWKAETAAIENRQKTYSADWKKDIQEFNLIAKQQQDIWNKDIEEINILARQQKDLWNKDIQEFTALARQQTENLEAAMKKQRDEWEIASRNTGREIVSATQERLDEYRLVQEEQFKQLFSIANDTAQLEVELRRSMQDAKNRVNSDFALFGQEIRGTWESASGELNSQLQALRDELAGIDRELAVMKEKAIENVSEKLKVFEDDFLADLGRRGAKIDQHLNSWQETLDKRLESIAADSETKRQKAEAQITEDAKKAITAQGEKIVSDLERLKAETAAFEEGIREEMHGADESRKSFNEQLERNLEEVKNAAQNEINTKIGQYNLSVSDMLRQSQRDLEKQIQELVTDTKERFTALETSSEEFRKGIEEWQIQYNARMRELDNSIEEWQIQYNARMRELDNSMEESRRRSRELATENDEQLMAARNSLDEMRHEITAQVKLFDHTDMLKAELNRHIEDMSGNIERLLQFKNEIAHFENQFIQIKRLADDVNAKMTHFNSEKRRIEVMEADFTRLLQTSQSVEEKLAQVSNSDDILQAMQIQIRRLEDAIKEADEKYKRVERKSRTLQETNDSIDRNFKTLQEDELLVKKLENTISTLKIEMEAIQSSVQTLSEENEKARDAAAKLSTLDETVKWLEKRIAEMNVARESLARLASELQNLDKDAQDQLNLTRSLLNREEGKIAGRAAGKAAGKTAGKTADDGAPPPRDRENIIRLKRQGWSIDEIARSMKISKGEVELILELGPKDV